MHNAELYHQYNKMQHKIAAASLKVYGSRITWKETKNRIFDVGSGDGAFSNKLRNYISCDFTLLGCDINESMVKLANSKYRDEKTSFMLLDIAGDITEEMKENFSHVFSFFAINCITDQGSTLKNIYNMLESGGECFLNIVAYSPINDVYRKLEIHPKWNTWVYNSEKYLAPYHDYEDPKKEVTKMMKHTGFDNIVVEHEEVCYVFENKENMKNTMRAINPFKIPNEKYDEFWTDSFKLLKKICSKIHDSDYLQNDYRYTFNLLTVHAQKLTK